MASVARFDTWQAADGTNVARFSGGELQVWDGAAWGPAGAIPVEFLIAGGGGGGGHGGSNGGGGGAGAGAVLTGTRLTESNTILAVKIAAGGTGAVYNSQVAGTNGSETSFGTNVAIGGGGGGPIRLRLRLRQLVTVPVVVVPVLTTR